MPSLPEQRTASDLYALAVEKYKSEEYQEAIDAFRKSLALQEHWNSYQGLGWGLFYTNQCQEAIDAFRKSLALQEDWNSYQGLGCALLRETVYAEAIDAFRKSLALQEDWNSYQGLGWAFFRANVYTQAIDAFRKSLALHEHWNVYLGLGRSLFKTNQYQEAIEAFRKALALNNLNSNELTAELHRELADAYEGAGKSDASIASWEVYLSYLEPISSLDPFLGNRVIYEQVDHEQIERIKSTCASIGLDFNPSLKGDNDASIESWKYLMYLHIPKCGGTSFETPLYLLKEHLKDKSCDLPKVNRTNDYLAISRLASNHSIAAFTNLMSSNSCNGLKNAFLGLHGAKWSALHDYIGELTNACPRIITTVRDPRQRLLSHIKHQAFQYCTSIDDLLTLVDNQNSIFNNLMHRQIFDYGLDGDNPCGNSELGSERLDLLQDMDFIDISDSTTNSKVKSSFLSASLFPNIVQTSRFNDSKEREEMYGFKISGNDIQYIFKHCVDKGFLEKDQSIDYDFLKNRTLERLHFPSFMEAHTCYIHPLTFVIFGMNRYSIVTTKKFLDNPHHLLQELNQSL
ncbi:tetratricopeptide repeat protein [Prochlorococcus marinus]|nr:tetratricopeptide repeat protein [Prochlorococcus marinus]